MEITSQHPLVSVAVIAYNSAEYILETLESIKAQTYDNIELIVSDDCSSDNTLDICRKWIDDNQTRFINVRIVESPTNTGQSGNYNRAFDACTGEWIKEIDGDDALMPDCISTYMQYAANHPDVQCIFSKIKCFGSAKKKCQSRELLFDYDFFNLTPSEQINSLINNGNGLPGPSFIYKSGMQIRCDERIPLLEDWPRWINIIQSGIQFHFIDYSLVCYRVNDKLTFNSKYLRSQLLFDLYYRYPIWIKDNPSTAELKVVDELESVFLNATETNRIRNSKAYRLGKFLLKPLRLFKQK